MQAKLSRIADYCCSFRCGQIPYRSVYLVCYHHTRVLVTKQNRWPFNHLFQSQYDAASDAAKASLVPRSTHLTLHGRAPRDDQPG